MGLVRYLAIGRLPQKGTSTTDSSEKKQLLDENDIELGLDAEAGIIAYKADPDLDGGMIPFGKDEMTPKNLSTKLLGLMKHINLRHGVRFRVEDICTEIGQIRHGGCRVVLFAVVDEAFWKEDSSNYLFDEFGKMFTGTIDKKDVSGADFEGAVHRGSQAFLTTLIQKFSNDNIADTRAHIAVVKDDVPSALVRTIDNLQLLEDLDIKNVKFTSQDSSSLGPFCDKHFNKIMTIIGILSVCALILIPFIVIWQKDIEVAGTGH